MKLVLRPAASEDADLLLAWRNDPDVVRFSSTHSVVTAEEHRRWIDARFQLASPRLWIAELGGTSVGQLRLDVEDGVGEISISIAREYRGMRLAPDMLRSLFLIASADSTVNRLIARVKEDNLPSIRAFERAGFTRADGARGGWLEFDAAAGPVPVEPVSQEVTGKRLIRNTAINGAANSIGALLTIALTPFFLHRLGAPDYGIWLLGLTFTFSSGYVVLADLGLQEAVVRFVAEARATNDSEVVSRIASSTLAVFLAAGAFAGIVTVLVAPLLVQLFHVPTASQYTARLVFSFVAVGIVVELPTAAFLAVIEGVQRYGWLRSIDVGGRLGWAALSVLAVLGGGGVSWLAAALMAMAFVQALAAVLVAHHVQPGLVIGPHMVDRATLRRMFGYGWMLAVLRVVSVVYAQMDRAIVGAALGVAAVARYEVVYRIEAGATYALVTASSAVVPASAYNTARMDTDRQRELYITGSRYAVAFAAPITLSALLYARPLIDTWVGSDYADLTGTAQLFLAFPLFWCVHVVGIGMLVGQGRIRRLTAIQTASVFLNLALSMILVRPLGITGVVAGTVIASALAFVPYLLLLLDTFDCSLRVWMRRVVAPNVAGAVAQLTFALLTVGLAERVAEFWLVAAFGAASCAVSAIAFFYTGLTRDERATLVRQVRQ